MESPQNCDHSGKPKLLDQVRRIIRHKRHPREMGETEINQFIKDKHVATSTQNQASCAAVTQEAVKQAIRSADITKQASCHTFRHSFAAHLLESGYDIRTVQELSGHKNVETSMIYTHVLNPGGKGVRSPADVI